MSDLPDVNKLVERLAGIAAFPEDTTPSEVSDVCGEAAEALVSLEREQDA